MVSKPENICDRPTEAVPQFTTSLTDGAELFSGLYPVEITYSSDHPMKEAQILINDAFYRSVNLGEKQSGTAKAEFGISRADGAEQSITIRVVDTFGYSTSRNYRIKVLDKDSNSPIIKTDNPTVMTIKNGQQISFSGTINDDSDISKIQVFVDDLLYGTFQGVRKYNFTLKSPADLPVGKHIVSIQVSDFQKNLQTLVHTVTVQ